MDNIINVFPDGDYTKLATDKLANELKDFKGDQYGNAVKDHVASILTKFCEDNNRFAEVVYKTKRTLSDCCAEIMKGCKQYMSDIDVYRGAVRNYFPNADIDFHMTITINGEAPSEEEMNRVPPPKVEKQPKPKKPAKAAEKPKSKPTKAATQQPKPKPEKKEAPKPKAPEIIQLSLF